MPASGKLATKESYNISFSSKYDPYCRMLAGHSDGWMCGYAFGEASGAAVERRYCFAAFRGGAVTALCATAWGDLWAASSRGGIRQEVACLASCGQGHLPRVTVIDDLPCLINGDAHAR